MGGIGGRGRFKTRGGGNHSSGGMGVSAGMGFCGSPSRKRGGNCMSGGMGLFSAGMGFGGSPSPLKGRGNCSSGGMGCFLRAWGYHPELGHHLGKGPLIWGNGDFIRWKCHVIWGLGVCQQLRINFTGLNGYIIWGRGCRHPAQDHVYSVFFLFCFSSVFLSGL